jgi:NADH dehydrogenase
MRMTLEQLTVPGLPKVVIIGGGFGGIRAAHALRNAPVQVFLIDRTNHHLFQPLLYQVATCTLRASDIASPLREILRNQKNVTVIQAEMTGVDVAARKLFLDGDPVPDPYDYLILATGATHSYLGHDEFANHAPGLKSLADAEAIRNKILKGFELCERAIEPAKHPDLITFVIVGAGPTGVEMAGAIAEMARRTLAAEFRRYDPRSLRVILVQSGPRILPSFPEKLARKAHARLERLGVEVRTNSRVESVDADGVVIKGERILCANVFWAAGVKPSPAGQWLGVETDKACRVKVNPDCSVPGHPEVFVLGDTASFDEGGKPLPGVAQVAMQQGSYVGRLIKRRVAGQPQPPPFKYFDKGGMAVIGRWFAILDGFGMQIAGLPAYLAWAFIHVRFLPERGNRLRTMVIWAWSVLTNKKVDALIIEPRMPMGNQQPAAGGVAQRSKT